MGLFIIRECACLARRSFAVIEKKHNHFTSEIPRYGANRHGEFKALSQAKTDV
jgi:hypothetical protein